MALRVPDYDAQVGLPGPEAVGIRATPGAFGAGIGEGLQDVAGGLENIGRAVDSIVDFRRTQDLSEWTTKSTAGLFDLYQQESIQQDPDPERFATAARKQAAAYKKEIKDPEVGQLWEQRWNDMVVGRRNQLVALKREKYVSRSTGDLIGHMDATRKNLTNVVNADEWTRLVGVQVGEIQAAVKAGVLDEPTAQKLEIAFMGEIEKDMVLNDIQTDPHQAMKKLSDPKQYADLEPDLRFRLVDQAEREVARLERELELKRNEALRQIERRIPDELASVMTTGQDMGLLRQLRALDPAAAAEYAPRLEATRKAGRILYGSREKPFADRLTEAQRLKPAPGENGFAHKQDLYERVVRVIQGEAEDFRKDPAGYVGPEVAGHVQKMVAEGLVDAKDPAAITRAAVDSSVAMQKSMGAVIPKILGDQDLEDLKARFEVADSSGKIGMLQSMQAAYGGHYGQAVSEMKLSGQHAFVATLAQDPKKLPAARLMMQISDKKPSDFEIRDLPAKATKETAFKAFDKTDFGAVLSSQSGLFQNVPGFVEYEDSLRDLMYKTTLHYISTGNDVASAAEKAAAVFSGLYSTIRDDELGFALLPREVDPETAEDVLRKAREKVPGFIEWQKPLFATPQIFEQKVSDLVEGGLWVNSPDGKRLILVDPATQAAVSGQNGEEFAIEVKDIQSMYEAGK